MSYSIKYEEDIPGGSLEYMKNLPLIPKEEVRSGKSYLLVWFINKILYGEKYGVLFVPAKVVIMGVDLWALDRGELEGEVTLQFQAAVPELNIRSGVEGEWDFKDYRDYWGLRRVI